MDRDVDVDLAALPETYAEALRLRDEGLAGAAIAVRLDIPVESVEPLLEIAEAKLAGAIHKTATNKTESS